MSKLRFSLHPFRFSLEKICVTLYFLAWTVYFAFFWSHALFLDKMGNFFAGHVNIWGDWAAHFTMTTALQQRGVSIDSPFMVGTKFSYPFGADYVSSLLLRAGTSFMTAFTLPSFCFSLLVVFGLYFFYRVVFQSWKISILASLIFLLNGGIGFYYFGRDILASPTPMETFRNPPHEYTRLDKEQIKWISVIDSMIIPQRAFALGFPVAVIGLALVWMLTQRQTSIERTALHNLIHHRQLQKIWRTQKGRLAAALATGLLIGTLPILHTHSFLAVFVVLVFWSVLDVWQLFRVKKWAASVVWPVIAIGSGVVAVPLISRFFYSHVESGNFFSFYPGWLAKDYHMNWLLFWWKNWGITPIVALIGGVVFLKTERRYSLQAKLMLSLPFWFLFGVANLFLFQPFAWDNTKLIVWAALGFAGTAGYLVAFLVRQYRAAQGVKRWLLPLIGIASFVLMTLSGLIDAHWIIRTDLHSYQMFSAEDLKLADWAKLNTPVNSIWLTDDHHNHWLFDLTGRQAVMTYRGWLWSHGYNYATVEHDVVTMYHGGPSTKELLKKYNVSYIVIGDEERRNFQANEAYFQRSFPVIKATPRTRIYQVE